MKIISLLLLTLLLSSCAKQAIITLPTARFETPEVTGDSFNGHVQFGYSPMLYATVVSDAQTVPPSQVGNDVHREYDTLSGDADGLAPLRITAGLSFFNKFQFNLGTSIGGILPMARLKYQFLGAPILQRKNNWVGSVSLGYWQHNNSENSGADDLSTDRIDLSIDYHIYEISASFGYRYNDFIVYMNTFYSSIASDTRITRTNNPTYNYNTHGEHYGAILGLRYDFWFGLYLGAEWVYNNVHIDSVKNRELGTLAAQLGFNWGPRQRKSKYHVPVRDKKERNEYDYRVPVKKKQKNKELD